MVFGSAFAAVDYAVAVKIFEFDVAGAIVEAVVGKNAFVGYAGCICPILCCGIVSGEVFI